MNMPISRAGGTHYTASSSTGDIRDIAVCLKKDLIAGKQTVEQTKNILNDAIKDGEISLIQANKIMAMLTEQTPIAKPKANHQPIPADAPNPLEQWAGKMQNHLFPQHKNDLPFTQQITGKASENPNTFLHYGSLALAAGQMANIISWIPGLGILGLPAKLLMVAGGTTLGIGMVTKMVQKGPAVLEGLKNSRAISVGPITQSFMAAGVK